MARDTPGSPMSRSTRDQLVSATATEQAVVTLQESALQQKMLEVMYWSFMLYKLYFCFIKVFF